MKLVLDTDALWHAPLVRALTEARALALDPPLVDAVLPAIAFAERLRQIRRDGRDEARWREALERAGIRVEPFSDEEASRLPAGAHDDAAWRAHARDFLVATHLRSGRVAVSGDAGPPWRGADALTPAEAAEAVTRLLAARAGPA